MRRNGFRFSGSIALFMVGLTSPAQTVRPDPLGYTVATPRPINPAEGTTSPSAEATQQQNPFLGSISSPATGGIIKLSFREAIERGLRYNLGFIESNQAGADARAARLRSLSALLPQISADARQAFDN